MRFHASLSSLFVLALSNYVAATGRTHDRFDLTAADGTSAEQWPDAPPTYEEAMTAAVSDLHDYIIQLSELRSRTSRRRDASLTSLSSSHASRAAIDTASVPTAVQGTAALPAIEAPATYKLSNIEHAFLDPREHDRLSMTGSTEEMVQIRKIIARIVKRKLQEAGTPGYFLRDHVDARHPYSMTRLLEDSDRWTSEISQLQNQLPRTLAEFTNRRMQIHERCQMMAQTFSTAKRHLKPSVFDLLQRFYMVNVCTSYRV